jgi:hypothetical protein
MFLSIVYVHDRTSCVEGGILGMMVEEGGRADGQACVWKEAEWSVL